MDVKVAQAFAAELDRFLKESNPKSENLISKLEEFSSTMSPVDSLVSLYSTGKLRPSSTKIIDRCIEFLGFHRQPQILKIFDDEKTTFDLFLHAILHNNEFMFKMFIRSGVSPNLIAHDKKTPLAFAVVANQHDTRQRLKYVEILLDAGADPFLRDFRKDTPFKRLCGMGQSNDDRLWSRFLFLFVLLALNFPLVYEFYRDFLLNRHPDRVQEEFNEGLTNAMFNLCLPIIVDLIDRGAILKSLEKLDTSLEFLRQMFSTIFIERHNVTLLDVFIESLIEIVRHGGPCEDYSTFLFEFLRSIFLTGIYHPTNNSPAKCPSPDALKQLLHHFYHFGYVNKAKANEIRTNLLVEFLNIPILTPWIDSTQRRSMYDTWCQYFDEMNEKYHQNPSSLRVFSLRKIRQSMTITTRTTIKELKLPQHLSDEILPPLNPSIRKTIENQMKS